MYATLHSFELPTYQLPPNSYHLPPTTYNLPPTTCHLPPVTCHLPPTTYHLPPTTLPLYHSTTYHLPPTTYHSLAFLDLQAPHPLPWAIVPLDLKELCGVGWAGGGDKS